jgi:Putative Ig domain
VTRGSHRHTVDRPAKLGGFASSVRAKCGRGGAHSWRPKHRRDEGSRIRRARNPIIVFVCAFVVASGSAAFAYSTTPGRGTGQAQAIALDTPGNGSASNPTTSSLSLGWVASSTLPAEAGYLVLRSASPGGPFEKVSSGTCQQSITVVSKATSCTDTDLTAGTTYYYQVEAAYYDISTLWVSPPDSRFSSTTSVAAPTSQTSRALSITSADDTTFAAGATGSFTVTTAGSPGPAITDTAFPGCTPSTLPGTVTLADGHHGTATLTGTPPAASGGSYTVCLRATAGANTATQSFTLRVLSGAGVTSAPIITSLSSVTFSVGSAGIFQVTASGSPAPAFANAAFRGCSPSTLPSGITFSSNGVLSGTPGNGAAGTYTVCVNAVNGISPDDTQRLTLTIGAATLAFSSPPVSGAASSTPNLGPITVRRQSGSGVPITSGGALTVNLTTSPGASFGAAQFTVGLGTSVTIPSGQSTASFWYGSTATGTMTIGATAPGYASGSQVETITPAPAGLGIALLSGSTGTPVLSCGPVSASMTCSVTGVGAAGRAAFSVTFWNAGKGPVVYSATQSSTVHETGQTTGGVTIGAGASGSGPGALTASLGTSTLTFGSYTLKVTVGA